MANAYDDFVKQKEFLVCLDSDGCVMDSVEKKHGKVFCPLTIRAFDLAPYAEKVTRLWMSLNLYSPRRGENRFLVLLEVFRALRAAGVQVAGFAEYEDWVTDSEELSARALQAEVAATGSIGLRRVLEWNTECNRQLLELEPELHPFAGVEKSLAKLHLFADVAVVSAANEFSIDSEWNRFDLAQYTDIIFGQEVGSKSGCIAAMLAQGYESRKVMMVGDALGDAAAAFDNGVAFMPILPGRETESWQRLQEEALPKLLHGTFGPEYQQELMAGLRSVLSTPVQFEV